MRFAYEPRPEKKSSWTWTSGEVRPTDAKGHPGSGYECVYRQFELTLDALTGFFRDVKILRVALAAETATGRS